MGRLSTCKGCYAKIKSEDKYTHSRKTYCKTCYDKLVYESEQRKLLLISLCENMKIDTPTGLMLKQLKEYKDTCNYSYAAMNYTLWYYVNILNKSLDVKYGLAFIRYYYENAKTYFIQQQNIKDSIKDIDEVEIKIKVIKIHSKSSNDNKLLINLNDFIGGK